MKLMNLCAALGVACLQVACSQAGEGSRRAPESAPCSPRTSADCAPGGQPQDRGLKPTVPPVPESPIKIDCQRLPTQVERDTCTNRKESTG